MNMLELGSYIRDCKSCKISVQQILMLLNVRGKETLKITSRTSQGHQSCSWSENFHPRKERERRSLDPPTLKLKEPKKGDAMCKASTLKIQLSSVLLHCMLESWSQSTNQTFQDVPHTFWTKHGKHFSTLTHDSGGRSPMCFHIHGYIFLNFE
jgi:hypothetical protein